MHRDIIGTVCLRMGETWESHGKGAPGGSVGSGERALVSSFCTWAMTSDGSVMSWPVVSSRTIERFVGRCWGFSPSSPVRNIDFSANLGLVMNRWSSFFPNEILRCSRACFRSRRVTRRWALKQAFSWVGRSGGGVSSSTSLSKVGARARVSGRLIAGDVIVRRVMGLETLSHRL